jgi:RNA recognition motif-containing protein
MNRTGACCKPASSFPAVWCLHPAWIGRQAIISEYFAMAKIYVGNLPFSADEAAVRALFSQHGTVESVALITDRDTGQPRGFGFVEMATPAAAKAAIAALNGASLDGRTLTVNEAKERSNDRGGFGGGGGGGGGGRGGRRY